MCPFTQAPPTGARVWRFLLLKLGTSLELVGWNLALRITKSSTVLWDLCPSRLSLLTPRHQLDLNHLRRAEDAHRDFPRAQAAVDDVPAVATPVDAGGVAARAGGVGQRGPAAGEADLAAMRVASQEDV